MNASIAFYSDMITANSFLSSSALHKLFMTHRCELWPGMEVQQKKFLFDKSVKANQMIKYHSRERERMLTSLLCSSLCTSYIQYSCKQHVHIYWCVWEGTILSKSTNNVEIKILDVHTETHVSLPSSHPYTASFSLHLSSILSTTIRFI